MSAALAPIEVADIRKGDIIRREQPENPRVKAVEYVALTDRDTALAKSGNPHFLVERPVVLPAEPGVYESSRYPVSDGFAPYRLNSRGDWYLEGSRMLPNQMTTVNGTLTRMATEPKLETALLASSLERILNDITDPSNAPHGTLNIRRARTSLRALIEAAKQ